MNALHQNFIVILWCKICVLSGPQNCLSCFAHNISNFVSVWHKIIFKLTRLCYVILMSYKMHHYFISSEIYIIYEFEYASHVCILTRKGKYHNVSVWHLWSPSQKPYCRAYQIDSECCQTCTPPSFDITKYVSQDLKACAII